MVKETILAVQEAEAQASGLVRFFQRPGEKQRQRFP